MAFLGLGFGRSGSGGHQFHCWLTVVLGGGLVADKARGVGCQESLYGPRVELGARIALDLPHSESVGASASVGAAGGHGVVGVHHGEDARAQRDLVAYEAAGVAAAIETFVVMEDDLSCPPEERSE